MDSNINMNSNINISNSNQKSNEYVHDESATIQINMMMDSKKRSSRILQDETIKEED